MLNPAGPPTPESPCTGVCRLDQAGVCIGCGRTGPEIGQWLEAGPARKREIRELAASRLARKGSR